MRTSSFIRRRGAASAAALLAVLAVLACGCAAGRAGVKSANEVIHVFGAKLGFAGIPTELVGASATEEPCLKGYERMYDSIAISIGFTPGGVIRKIATRNPGTAMFGIRPGDPLDASTTKAITAGLRATSSPGRFTGRGCALALMIGADGSVFGLSVERLE